jgi:HAE1 family hydrophobic/amphiphilic exporter-1/multidrug efflux pump
MEAVDNDTFAMSDVNLKFNKPEVNVFIDQRKAEFRNIGCDIAQTLQLSLSWTTFWLFHEKVAIRSHWTV